MYLEEFCLPKMFWHKKPNLRNWISRNFSLSKWNYIFLADDFNKKNYIIIIKLKIIIYLSITALIKAVWYRTKFWHQHIETNIHSLRDLMGASHGPWQFPSLAWLSNQCKDFHSLFSSYKTCWRKHHLNLRKNELPFQSMKENINRKWIIFQDGDAFKFITPDLYHFTLYLLRRDLPKVICHKITKSVILTSTSKLKYIKPEEL